jgi:dolichyl-phosphate-mannose-protein mannosyltransferase
MSLSAPQQRRPLSGPAPAPAPKQDADADAKLRDRHERQEAFGGRKGARAGALLGLRRREWIILGAVCVVASFVRLWNLAHPSSVV